MLHTLSVCFFSAEGHFPPPLFSEAECDSCLALYSLSLSPEPLESRISHSLIHFKISRENFISSLSLSQIVRFLSLQCLSFSNLSISPLYEKEKKSHQWLTQFNKTHQKKVFLCLLALALQATAQSDISHLDPNCNCVYNWIGPNAFYNFWTLTDLTYATYSEADFWSPDPNIEIVPCQVCYVFINGNNYIFVDNFTYVNEMNIGGNEWDDATVIVGGPGRDNETVYLRIGAGHFLSLS